MKVTSLLAAFAFFSGLTKLVQGLFGKHFVRSRHLYPTTPASGVTTSLRAGGTSSTASRSTPGPAIEYRIDKNGGRPPTRALIVMDCFCPYHGMYLAQRALQQYPGVAVIFMLSDYLRGYLRLTQPDSNERWEAARIPNEGEELEEWKDRVGRDVEFVGVYCESDSGLSDAEVVRERLNVRCQDKPPVLEARRHKYLMNVHVANSGLTILEQKLCSNIQEAHEFAKPFLNKSGRVVVKPYRGCATESVFLCDNPAQVAGAWEKIIETKVFGTQEKHSSVLVQEYAVGTEYAVDVVSRDGHHRVAAIWKYDKRPANGAPFCYFRTELVDSDTDSTVGAVVEHVLESITALGLRWGTSHNEVIATENKGPLFVEVNCRQHNMNFLPLTMACIGYNALDMTLDSFLGSEEDWDKYPDLPTLRAAGCMVHLVNYESGKLVQNHHIGAINDMPSVLDFEIYSEFCTPGVEIKKTLDIKTDAGWVQLINDDRDNLEEDYKKIVDLMPTMFQVDE